MQLTVTVFILWIGCCMCRSVAVVDVGGRFRIKVMCGLGLNILLGLTRTCHILCNVTQCS